MRTYKYILDRDPHVF